MSEDIDDEFEASVESLKNYRGNTSRLRREITKVSALTENACKVINRHLAGQKCDDKALESAKWVLTTLQSLYDTAIREESVKGKKSASRRKPARSSTSAEKSESQDGEEEVPEVKDNRPRLSMTYTPDRSTISESEKVDGADTEF